MDTSQYLQAFLEESLENTQVLNTVCLRLEGGQSSDDDFATMFRAAHTLKGMSATMGYSKMAALTHRLEDALGFLRAHPEQISPDFTNCLFNCIDALESSIQHIRDRGHEPLDDNAILIGQLSLVGSTEVVNPNPFTTNLGDKHLENNFSLEFGTSSSRISQFFRDSYLSEAVCQCQAAGLWVGIVTVTVDEKCAMKGARGVLIGRVFDQFGGFLQSIPAPDVLEAGMYEAEIHFVVAIGTTEVGVLISQLGNMSEVSGVASELWDDMLASVSGPATSESVQLPTMNETAISIEPPMTSANINDTTGKAITNNHKIEKTIRVSVERLDGFMNMLSELVIDRTRLASLAQRLNHGPLTETVEHMSRVSSDMQAAIMGLRMVPVDSLFQRFPRLVRDLAKSLGKQIRLEMSGLDTEFDRTIIDEMGEALVHLIRNAADHGLELPGERQTTGKIMEGTIYLKAYAQGQHVCIEVGDDGKGIHVEIVRKKAVEKGIISEQIAATLSEEDVHQLLFSSGFSTADQVSDISGRGVGLDAVKGKVESLGGTILVRSKRGSGSTFLIQLPLTVSILQALMVQIDKDIFALPLNSIEEVSRAGAEDLRTVQGVTYLHYQNELVPILDTGSRLFNHSSLAQFPWKLVVCKSSGHHIAVAVDKLLGQQEIVNKPLGAYLEDIKEFSGATILGDGNIALILDVVSLMNTRG